MDRLLKSRVYLIAMIWALIASVPATSTAQQTPIQPEIDRLSGEISAAEADNAKYSGGLVKALNESRIATLKQTKAMLDQRKAAADRNVSLHYTIDGKPFALPAGAKDEAASIQREIDANRLKIAAAESEAANNKGGLVLAMTLSNIATLRQTEAMLDQKRMALTFGLPQFIGFANSPAGTPNTTPVAAKTAPTNWEIIDVDAKVTESNSTRWRYAGKSAFAIWARRLSLFAQQSNSWTPKALLLTPTMESQLASLRGRQQR